MRLQHGNRVLFARAFLGQGSDLIIHLSENRQGQIKDLGQASLVAWKETPRGPIIPAVSHPEGFSFELSFRIPIEGLPERILFNAE